MIIVITLNYNQNDYTLKCVESIMKSEDVEYHILLIDNGSTKENISQLTKAAPKSNNLTLLKIDKNIGYVGGINYGLKKGMNYSPNYFLILNNDTIIDERAIYELTRTCQKFNNKAIVSGKVYHYEEPNKLQDVGTLIMKNTLQFNRIVLDEIDNGQYDQLSARDMLDDVFWLFPAELYIKIGGYSTYFWFNAEQADFALRAKKENYKLMYTPNAKIWHKGSVSIGGKNRNPKLAYWHIQSSLILRYLHLSKKFFFLYFFQTMFSIFLTTVKSFLYRLKGDKSLLKYAYAKRKGMMYFLKWSVIKNKNTGKCPV